jgi:hypothetical protein
MAPPEFTAALLEHDRRTGEERDQQFLLVHLPPVEQRQCE